MGAHETWREVPDLVGCFVSDFGRVRKHDKPVRLTLAQSGHLMCSVFGRACKVHQLVAAAFHGPRPKDSVVMHMNHTPWDNRPGNLSYGTVGENIRMDFEAGTRSNKGDRAPNRTLSETDVLTIRASKLTNTELADIYSVSRPNISKVRNFVTWTEVPNVTGPFLTSKTPTGETHMAKAPKTISASDKKAQLAGLKTAVAQHNANTKSISAALKEAAQAKTAATKAANAEAKLVAAELAVQKKAADTAVFAANKAAEVALKAVNAGVAAADKAFAAAEAKAAKLQEAAAKGAEKLAAQIAALEALPVAAPAKATKAKAPVVEEAPV